MSTASAQVSEIISELREERERRGLSQQVIADVVGVSRGQIGHWETGRNNQQPDIEQLTRWAQALNWSIRMHLERGPDQAPAPTEDFATVVGRLGIIWRELPDSARRGISELIRGFTAMSEKR